jgi:acyl-CoA thioesterase
MEMDSPNMGGESGIAHSRIFNEKGILVASATQEGVARYRK